MGKLKEFACISLLVLSLAGVSLGGSYRGYVLEIYSAPYGSASAEYIFQLVKGNGSKVTTGCKESCCENYFLRFNSDYRGQLAKSMYAMLLTAMASGKEVEVYTNDSDCSNGRLRVTHLRIIR